MQLYLYNIYSNLLWPRQVCKWSCSTLKVDSTVFKSGVFLTKFGHKLLLSLSAQPDYVWTCLKKVIAGTLCFMHQGIVGPNYISINDAYFLNFRAQKFHLIFLNLNPF